MAEESKPTVKVFSTPTCPWCVKVKEFLKQHKIPYDDLNVAENAEARDEMVEKSGQMGVPVTMIGDQIIVGFDKEALMNALGVKE